MIEDHAAAAMLLEAAAVAAAIGTPAIALRNITTKLVAQWVILFGSVDAAPDAGKLAGLMSWLRTALSRIEIKPGAAIREHGRAARVLGQRQARQEMGRPAPHQRVVQLDEDTERAADEADEATADRLAAAVRLLPKHAGEVEQREDFAPALGAAQSAVTRAQTGVMWAVHHELNAGIADEIADAGGEQLWVPERDACAHCLAYAGELAEPGRSFELGLTFGDKPLQPWPDATFLGGPPLHPWCRCRLFPWMGSDGVDGLRELPEVLRHEAKRSVLKGWALPSESAAVRARAADKLLAQGAGLPRSVEQEARRKLRAGRFTTGPVPDGTATEEQR